MLQGICGLLHGAAHEGLGGGSEILSSYNRIAMKTLLTILLSLFFAAFFLNLAYQLGKRDQRIEHKQQQAAQIRADIERMNEAFNR